MVQTGFPDIREVIFLLPDCRRFSSCVARTLLGDIACTAHGYLEVVPFNPLLPHALITTAISAILGTVLAIIALLIAIQLYRLTLASTPAPAPAHVVSTSCGLFLLVSFSDSTIRVAKPADRTSNELDYAASLGYRAGCAWLVLNPISMV